MFVSIKSRIAASCAFLLLVSVFMVSLALQLPDSSVVLETQDERIYAQLPGNKLTKVLAFQSDDRLIKAHANLLIAEPDVLPAMSAYRQVIQSAGELTTAVKKNHLQMITPDGAMPIRAIDRQLSTLPLLFWLQLSYVLLAGLICAMIWIPAERSRAMFGFLITGLGLVICIAGASIYSTRNLFIDAATFELCHGLNLFGSLLFGSGLVILTWSYPKPLIPRWLAGLLLFIPVTGVGVVSSGLNVPMLSVFYGPHILMSLVALIGVAVQWFKSKGKPLARAQVRWTAISVLVGPLVFVGVAMIPAALGFEPMSEQAVTLGAFLFMYFSLFFAVKAHSVFNLEQWSRQVWIWLIGGLLVLAVDILIASAIGLSGPATLTLALALVGWVYFPLRQWLWRRLFSGKAEGLDTWLYYALPELMKRGSESDEAQRVVSALKAVFDPLQAELSSSGGLYAEAPAPLSGEPESPQPIRTASTQLLRDTLRLFTGLKFWRRLGPSHFSGPNFKSEQAVRLIDSGTTLQVSLGEHFWCTLKHADQGRRLFTSKDVRVTGSVLSLNRLMNQTQSAKTQGALEERARIRRDLHDDMGAKLLRLLHRAAPSEQALVRGAIKDLRSLLNQQQPTNRDLLSWVSRHRQEAEQRAFDARFDLKWNEHIQRSAPLPELASLELGRVLREALSNAFKYADQPWVHVRVRCEQGEFECCVENAATPNAEEPSGSGESLGLQSMAQRMRSIGAQFDAGLNDSSQLSGHDRSAYEHPINSSKSLPISPHQSIWQVRMSATLSDLQDPLFETNPPNSADSEVHQS